MSDRLRRAGVVLLSILLLIAGGRAGPGQAAEEEFSSALSRVDRALQTNPNHVANQALTTCNERRTRAAILFRAGDTPRARRSLAYCFSLLGIPETADPREAAARTAKRDRALAEAERQRQERAVREYERALALKPDLENGLEIYRECAVCHGAEAWGMPGAGVPQLAGQHRRVLIEQLADIRAGNRENQIMLPYASVEAIGGAQAIANVTGYIDTLEISIENGKGPGKELSRGEQLYSEKCMRCHDLHGEGDDEKRIPRIQAQHYHYLIAQFAQIRDGRRRIENEAKIEVVKSLEDDELSAIMDHVSRLQPPELLRAPPGWRNPDFQ